MTSTNQRQAAGRGAKAPRAPAQANTKANTKANTQAPSTTQPAPGKQPPATAQLLPQAEALQKQNRLTEALALYQQFLAAQPGHAPAHYQRGMVLKGLGQLEQALLSLDVALKLQPDYAECLANRGVLLQEMQRPDEALACYDRALQYAPRSALLHYNRGTVLEKLQRHAEALATYEQAIALNPGHAIVHYNRGVMLERLLRHTQAIASYDQAIALQPDYPGAQLNRALCLLVTGNFEQGWPAYEWRWKSDPLDKEIRFAEPPWLGQQSLAGKTLLLHAEQGYGDTLQFCRYTRLLAAMGARLVLEVPRGLVLLMATLEGVVAVSEQGAPHHPYDYHCPMLSLPLACQTRLGNIPASVPYLKTTAAKRQLWSQRLDDRLGDGVRDGVRDGVGGKLGGHPRIGLTWSGNPEHDNDQQRSIPLATLLQHLPSGFAYVSLQQEVRTSDRAALEHSGMAHFGAEIKDFTDTAALVELLDLVISVDTSVAHLAGALGKETWLLLPYVPDWRWLLGREDSPWYPSLKLWRKAADQQWAPVLQRVAEALHGKSFAAAARLAAPVAAPVAPLAPAPPSASTPTTVATPPTTSPDIALLFSQGLALHQQGQFAPAQALYEQVLAQNPTHFDALHLLGAIAYQTKHLERAVALIGQAIQLNPKVATAHSNRGLALHDLGRLEQAMQHYDQAVALEPENAVAHYNRGNTLKELQRFDQAVASYQPCIALEPGNAKAHHNLGLALKGQGQLEAALESYDRALALNPDLAACLCSRGVVLQSLERLEESLASFNRAIASDPAQSIFHFNRATTLEKLGRYSQALASYEQAIAIQPHYHEAWLGRGNALEQLMRQPEALASFERSIAIKPDYATGHWNKSLICLVMGRYAEGWPLYEWGWKNQARDIPRNFTQPLWLGRQSLAGKTILLYQEQGLGDALQFCRYARMVADQGAKVVLELTQPLLELLKDVDGVSAVTLQGQPLPHFDYQCPMLSLPLAFNTQLHSIPKAQGYLRSNPGKRQAWSARLGAKTKPRIGLAWSGFTRHKNDRKRSIPLADLYPYLPTGYDYVSLQKEVRDSDQAALQASGVRHFGELIQDFTDTAALVDLMDVVISVDTSVVHLSGALGKTTWVLLPYIPDWRWLLGREDSAWYASVRLFRQGADRQWTGVLQRVAQALALELALELAPQTLEQVAPAAEEQDAKAHCQRAVELIGSQQYAAALLSCERAIALDPDYVDAHGNRGVALQGLGRFAEALQCYDRVIAASPDYAHAHCNRGIVFQELMRMEEAVISLNRAIALRPDFAYAQWNKAINLLLQGHYPEGWALYEWGWQINQRGPVRNFAQPLWKGAESLAGKTILLHAEQGIGDAIQFSRYARLVSERGARVILEVRKPLLGVFTHLQGVAQRVEQGQPLPAFDYHCPLMTLPLAFQTQLNTIPSPWPYLQSDAERRAVWQQRLGPPAKPRVGLVWSGSPGHSNDRNRSMRLEQLLPYLPAGFDYICLHKEVRPIDQAALGRSGIRFVGAQLQDYSDTAALTDLMDLVITVDSGVAHLAGALGKPVWVLLPYMPDWRWLLHRTDSPWYDTARLYRQTEDRRWEPLLERVAGDLRRAVGGVKGDGGDKSSQAKDIQRAIQLAKELQ